MKLCINPSCNNHCDVVWDEQFGRWRFSNGFQMSLSKSQLSHFDPENNYNLCGACAAMIPLLQSLNLIQKYGE